METRWHTSRTQVRNAMRSIMKLGKYYLLQE
jgi:hypothetical protein